MKEFDERNYPHHERSEHIIGAAIKVHRTLGPGLLESAYEVCLSDEIQRCGLHVERQVALPIIYEGRQLDCVYKLDLVVNDLVIIELKCVEKVLPIHEAQLMTYMRLARKEVGLLINFNVNMLRDGVKRKVLAIQNLSSELSATLR